MTQAPEQQLATTVTNLVVTPQPNGVSVGFNTATTVRAELQIGTVSGTYANVFGLEAVPRTVHLLYGFGLNPGTVYHYVIQFFDLNGTMLDATTDATFTTLAAPATGSAQGVILGLPGKSLMGGNGVPPATLGQNGSFYFRWDGSTGAYIYHKAAGAWTAVI